MGGHNRAGRHTEGKCQEDSCHPLVALAIVAMAFSLSLDLQAVSDGPVPALFNCTTFATPEKRLLLGPGTIRVPSAP